MRNIGLAAAVALSLLSAGASADWPMARHDALRTGTSTGSSNIAYPVPYFRKYLGGGLSPLALWTADFDNDGRSEVAYVQGGRLHLKGLDDSLAWRTSNLQLTAIVGLDDFDGDGSLEIVARSKSRAFLIDGASGEVAWAQDPAELGDMAALFIADFSGDGLPDLFLEESRCGIGSTTNPGFVYGFGSGISNPSLLWEIPSRSHCGPGPDVVVDMTGDGYPEVFVGATERVELLGSSGATIAASADTPFPSDQLYCQPANIDDDAADEVVCLGTAESYRHVYAFNWGTVDGAPALVTEWEYVPSDPSSVISFPSSVTATDLDGDGVQEIVASVIIPGESISTVVLDAATGTLLGQQPGTYQGSAAIESSSTRLVLAAVVGNPDLSYPDSIGAYAFDRSAAPNALSERWVLPDAFIATVSDRHLFRTRQTNASLVPATIDADADGISDLIVITNTTPRVIQAMSATTGAPVSKASWELPYPAGISSIWQVPPVDQSYPQIVVARTDGHLNPLDSHLQPTNLAVVGGGQGVRVGAHYAASIASFAAFCSATAYPLSAPWMRAEEIRFWCLTARRRCYDSMHPRPAWLFLQVRYGTFLEYQLLRLSPGLEMRGASESQRAGWRSRRMWEGPPTFWRFVPMVQPAGKCRVERRTISCRPTWMETKLPILWHR